MKIFLDSANLDEIKKVKETGILDGITTNPTLIANQTKQPEKLLEEISKLTQVPVLAEPVSTKTEDIIQESLQLAKISEFIVPKIPITEDGLKAVKFLFRKNIKTAVTLVFSPVQALLVAKTGANYVCPFVGRMDDTGTEGMNFILDIINIYRNYNFKTEILVVSVRTINHVLLASQYGVDGISLPFKIIQQLYKHPLTDIGIKKFLEDWQKIK